MSRVDVDMKQIIIQHQEHNNKNKRVGSSKKKEVFG